MRLDALYRPALWSFGLQRLCTWYPLRRPLARWIAASRPDGDSQADPANGRIAAELERDGVSLMPGFVDGATVLRIRKHLEGAELRERFAPFRRGFTLENVPHNVHVAEYVTEHVLASPDVMALANHPAVLASAAAYLGCKPTISNLSVWWSLPADGSAQEAENYHRDVDDWRFVKLFVYLSDVDDGAGPHCFVRGSHRSPRFLAIRRVADPEVEAAFPVADRLRLQGKTGDAFLEDTFGLHKGQPPTRTPRLLFQVEYSINPIAVYHYEPAPRRDGGPAFDAYTNRLYVTAERAGA